MQAMHVMNDDGRTEEHMAMYLHVSRYRHRQNACALQLCVFWATCLMISVYTQPAGICSKSACRLYVYMGISCIIMDYN